MTLSGGKADDLTLADFLDAGYALLVEAYQSIPGGHLIDALEKTSELAATSKEPEQVKEEVVEVQNQRSLEQLMGMMKGVVK